MKVEPIAEGGFDPSGRRKINEIIRALAAQKLLRTPEMDLHETTTGTFARPKVSTDDNTNNNAPRWG